MTRSSSRAVGRPPAAGVPPSVAGAPAPVRATLLVLLAIVSVQFGGALAATLVPRIGAAGSVTLRLLFGAVILLAVARPRLRGRPRSAWLTVVLFGTVLAAMNWTFYGSLGRLPIGVAVTIEFIGPLTLASVLSRRLRDLFAVVVAALGVLLISQALSTPWSRLDLLGLGLAATAGACWAAYIVLSARTGAAFPQLDGLALAMIVAVAIVLPFGLASVSLWTADILLKGAAVAVLSSVLPYSFELLALRRLSARVFGILLSLEPAVAAVAGLLVLGQGLTRWQLLGMALVVTASALVLGSSRRAPLPAESAAT